MRLAAALTILLCAFAAFAQSEAAPGVRLIRGAFVPGSQPDGNSVVFTTPAGLLVMDTGRHVAHTNKILDLAASEKLPIVAVVNSHWHLDHIGGNALIRGRFPGVKVYASGALEGARKGFLANYHRQLEEGIAKSSDPEEQKRYRIEMGLIDAADQLAPDIVISESGREPGTRTIAGRELEVGLETFAVTAGDVWLFDKKSGVLASGDLVTLPAPFLDTACPVRWEAALSRLSHTGFDLLIPGHGAPLTHRQFEVYRTAFSQLLRCASSDAAKTVCIDGWVTGVSDLIAPAERDFTRKLMDYYVDVLRRPAKFCQ